MFAAGVRGGVTVDNVVNSVSSGLMFLSIGLYLLLLV